MQAAKLGMRVAVVERGPCVGGGCVVDGTIPSKTFREAVRAAVRFRRSDLARRGDAVAVTARDLLGRVSAVRDRETEIIRDQLTRNGVTVIEGDARFIDPHRVAVESASATRVLEASYVLVATGTTAARPENVACDGAPVIVSDGVISPDRIPRTMAVIGGGVIGLEYASMFAALGSRVTVVDKRPRVLEFLDSEIVDELVHQMRGQGVTFRLGEAVADLAVVAQQSGHECGLLTLESGKRMVAERPGGSIRVPARMRRRGRSGRDEGRAVAHSRSGTAEIGVADRRKRGPNFRADVLAHAYEAEPASSAATVERANDHRGAVSKRVAGGISQREAHRHPPQKHPRRHARRDVDGVRTAQDEVAERDPTHPRPPAR